MRSRIMTKREALIHKIEDMPDPVIDEIMDFVDFLRMKNKSSGMETTILSESSLSKIWLTPEEDEAWKDL